MEGVTMMRNTFDIKTLTSSQIKHEIDGVVYEGCINFLRKTITIRSPTFYYHCSTDVYANQAGDFKDFITSIVMAE